MCCRNFDTLVAIALLIVGTAIGLLPVGQCYQLPYTRGVNKQRTSNGLTRSYHPSSQVRLPDLRLNARLPHKRRTFQPPAPEISSDLAKLVKLEEHERLQKIIARAGVASRRSAEKMILDGRVSVNGKIIAELGAKVNPKTDTILVNGQLLKLPEARSTVWLAVNKPRNVLSTTQDASNRETVLSLVPKASELRLVPVGRMERSASGLLLLTNDIGWIHPLTHPSYRHAHKYEITVVGVPRENKLEQLRKGVVLPGATSPTAPCDVNLLDVDRRSGMSLLELRLEEAGPNLIGELMQFVGCTVQSLKRMEFGTVRMRNLRKGEWRELTPGEVKQLKESCVKKQAPKDLRSRVADRRMRRLSAAAEKVEKYKRPETRSRQAAIATATATTPMAAASATAAASAAAAPQRAGANAQRFRSVAQRRRGPLRPSRSPR